MRAPAVCLINAYASGAEKRFLRMLTTSRGSGFWLIINSALVEDIRRRPDVRRELESIEHSHRLLILPSPPIPLDRRLQKLWDAFQVLRLVRRERIASLHAVLHGVGASQLAMVAGTPTVVEVTSPDFVRALVPHHRFKRNMLRRVAYFHTVSATVDQMLRASFHRVGMEDRVERIMPAPSPFFSPPEGVGEPPKEKLVVYASRFIERKNPILFARAARAFLKARPDWRVAVLGKGPLEDQVRQELADEIASGRAVVQYTKRVWDFMARSAVFVSLIEPDNYPSQSVLEAMYLRNALLASDVGDTRRLVAPENGILVPLVVEEVTRALLRLADDEGMRRSMGESSRQRVEREFSPERFMEHLNRLHAALNGPPEDGGPRAGVRHDPGSRMQRSGLHVPGVTRPARRSRLPRAS